MRSKQHHRCAIAAVLVVATLAGCSDTAVVLALQFNRRVPEVYDSLCLQLSTGHFERYARRFSVVDLKASKPTLTVQPGDSSPTSFELLLRSERAGLSVSWLRESVPFVAGAIERKDVDVDPCGVASGRSFDNGGRLGLEPLAVLAAMPSTLTVGDMVVVLTGTSVQRFGVLATDPERGVADITGDLPPPPQAPLGALALNVMFDAPEARDCDLDLLVLAQDRPRLWMQQNGLLTASGSTLLQGGWTSGVAADLDRNGRTDIVLGSEVGLALLLDTDNARYRPVENPGLTQAPQVSALAVGLLDDDGAPDILIGTPTGKDILLVNDSQGGGTFSELGAPGLTDADRETVALAVADLDGDRTKADIPRADVVRATKTGVEVLLNKGGGVFEAANVLPAGLDYGGVTQILAQDLNNDCTIDLVLVRPAGSQVLYNTGGGHFEVAPFAADARSNGSRAVAADLDGDGVLDLIFGGDTSVVGGGTYWIKQVVQVAP